MPNLRETGVTSGGEQWLGPYENCCLGSVNLARFVDEQGRIDWDGLAEAVRLSTHFLDNVVTANGYVPAVPELREAADRARRIGLGIMGLGDLLYKTGVRYGSRQAQDLAAQVMEFVRFYTMQHSIELARQRGPFPALAGSIYDPQNLKWQPPTPLFAPEHDWGRPALDWSTIVAGILSHGIRNACQSTVAPTGTISTVAGVEGYGCEPVFALAYLRWVQDNDNRLQLTYTSPIFEQALIKAGLDKATRARISEQVSLTGSCQEVAEVPEALRHTFVVASDITPEEHVRMQAVLQAFVDNSLSKCVTGDTLVLTAGGLVPIASLSDLRLPDQFKPHDLSIVSPTGVEPSDAFYYGGMRETRRVSLTHGYEIEGTPNHRVHTLGADGEIRFVRLDELAVGDTVVLYSGQQIFGAAGQPLAPAGTALKPHPQTARFPEAMSPELAYLLGVIISQGHMSRDTIQIAHHDLSLLEGLAQHIQMLFMLDSPISQDTRYERRYSLQLNARPLCDWLRVELGLEASPDRRTIPECILRAARPEIAAFLRGLLLDASKTLDGHTLKIRLASQPLMRQLQTLLLNFGVFTQRHQDAAQSCDLLVSGTALERLATAVELVDRWRADQHPTPQAGFARYVGGRAITLNESTAPRGYDHLDAPRSVPAFGAVAQLITFCVEVQRIEAGFAEVFDISVPGSHAFIANGLCNHNTINFPPTATVEDVATAYKLAWHLGCKGITVYVTGSRETVVLETKQTAQAKQGGDASPQVAPTNTVHPPAQPPKSLPRPSVNGKSKAAMHDASFQGAKKPRPRRLQGATYFTRTPLGKAYITVNRNGNNEPFEIFATVGKAGSDTFAISEAIGRLISLILRLPSDLSPTERLEQVCEQLAGIGGSRHLGFGPNRILSLPDALAQVLQEDLAAHSRTLPHSEADEASLVDEDSFHEEDHPIETKDHAQALDALAHVQHADLCPECGHASFVNEEGCRKCYSCAYSEC